jgi:hypothetical protein
MLSSEDKARGRGVQLASSVVPWSEYSPAQTENLIAAWLIRTVEGAQRVEGAGGDDGADVRAPTHGDGLRIFEIKSFHELLRAGQRGQIRDSLRRAVKRQEKMIRWTLVLPKELTPAEIRWFENTLSPLAGVPIDWIGRTEIEAGLSQHRDLMRAFAPGSTERRAMDILADYHAEQVAMTRGAVDGIERVRKLRQQFDLIDPYWTFDFRTQGQHLDLELQPKTEDSARIRPVTVGLSIAPSSSPETAESYTQMMRYGRPASFSREDIESVSVDLPGNLNELVSPETVQSLVFKKNEDESAWRLSQRIEAVKDGRIIATLPVEWNDRSRGPLGGSWLSGYDRSGFLEVSIKTEPDQKTGGMSVRSYASDNVLPEEALPALRFLAKLGSSDLLRLRAPDNSVAELRVSAGMIGPPEALEACILFAETLARVQANAGVAFPLPGGWSKSDGEMLLFCDEILLNGKINWYFPSLSVNVSASRVAALLAESVLPRISMSATSGSAPTPVRLLGNEILLPGELRCNVDDILVTNPRTLASQVGKVAPWTPLAVRIEQDNRTKTTFYLYRETEPEESQSAV